MIRLKHICIFGGLLVASTLQSWGQSTPVGDTQMYANYELAQRFQAFSLGGKLNNNSLRLYPNEINDTDNYVNPKEAKKELLFDNREMAMQLTELTHDVVNSARIDLNGIEFSKDQKTFTFRYNSKKYEYSRLTRKLKEVQEEKEEKEEGPIYSWMNFSPDKKYILYAKEHNLYVRGNKALGVDTTEVQLTTDGVEYFSYAKEEPEGDNGECRTNARWCPDSRHAYIVLDDERKLRNFWVINSLSERPSLKSYKYEFPGDKYVTQNELVIIDVVERTAKKAKVQKWVDQYVAPLHVTSDSKLLFFERTKRTWDEVDFCSVNLSTMEVKELIHEVDKPYRDPHARNSEVLNNGKDILFRSERTGWGHYYHYDGDGNLKNALSSGPWVSGHIVTVDSAARKVYFYGYGEDPNINPFYYRIWTREGLLLSARRTDNIMYIS